MDQHDDDGVDDGVCRLHAMPVPGPLNARSGVQDMHRSSLGSAQVMTGRRIGMAWVAAL